ncbi:MAG: hypothetical protein K5655_04425 [Lachnospiraceae bacterium]|nr:hypothetical protein [Lachnospiraceae bacterium]
MADNFMTYNDAVDVLTPYAEKINTIKPEPITWAAYQLLTTAQKEAKRYVITDYPSPDGYVDKLSDLEDVDINDQTLSNNQVPVYNSTTEKWENKSIIEDSLTSTATDKALSAKQGVVLDNKILFYFNDFVAKSTTFNLDGTITETDADGYTITTTFTSDTVTTQILKDSNNVVLATKTITIGSSTITEVLS